MYRISGNFWYTKIFVMEMFDHGNIWKGQPIVNFIYIHKVTFTKVICAKIQKWIEVLYFLVYLPWCYRRISLWCFETGVKKRRTFHHHHAASVKMTCLLRKDCLAGYRYEKVPVISKHYTHTSALLSTAVSSEFTQQRHVCHVVHYRNC